MTTKPNGLYIQSGGPTAVINSTAYGVIHKWRAQGATVGKLYAVIHGNFGLVNNMLYDTSEISDEELNKLINTPSMIFGSSRHRIPDGPEGYEQYDSIVQLIIDCNIHYIFYNGGDGSLRACNDLQAYLERKQIACSIIFIPKTVDNDIDGIDHAPGFPSTARYVNISISELVHDIRTYNTNLIAVVEVMGRRTGWLAASTLLAHSLGYGPDLIYVPECRFSMSKFIADVQSILQEKGKCVAVVAEGVRDEHNKFLFEYQDEDVEQPELNMGGITPYLTSQLKKSFSCKIRGIDLGLMQRCSSHMTSTLDIEEAIQLGEAAVSLSLGGKTGHMVYIERISSKPYTSRVAMVPIDHAINGGHLLPLSYVNENENFIKDAFIDYIQPLVGDLPTYTKLKFTDIGNEMKKQLSAGERNV